MVFSDPCGTYSHFCIALFIRGVAACGKVLILLGEANRALDLSERPKEITRRKEAGLKVLACLLTLRSCSGVSESVQGLGLSSSPSFVELQVASGAEGCGPATRSQEPLRLVPWSLHGSGGTALND